MVELLVQLVNEKAIIPSFAHSNDAGLDLYSVDNITIRPGEIKLIHTGIKVQLPPNTEAQIRPRSGMALNYGITVLNSPGTIDEGYRGEIGVILINHGSKEFEVLEGMKIAQMVINSIIKVDVKKVRNLSDSDRGEKGFGSTGIE
jgi:dUTP pyrophosphatase